MKTICNVMISVILGIIATPLILALLFMMPVEFVISTWHLSKVTESTEGIVTHSEITRGRKSVTGSRIAYTYSVNGTKYTSTRSQAGWISDSARQSGGGAVAESNPRGNSVLVHYDPRSPEFSIITWGWPKWSFGFSAGVWGLLSTYWAKESNRKGGAKRIRIALAKSLTFVGFITIFFFPITLGIPEMKILGSAFLGSAFAVFTYYTFRPFPKKESELR